MMISLGASRPSRAGTPPFVLEVPPRFRIATAPWDAEPDARTIVIAPSLAFGDGTHETTRMCLQALAAFAPKPRFRMLDVGSGSGVLSIAAAKLGGEALGVEIVAAANAVAAENARQSGVADRVTFGTAWPSGRVEVVVANILRGVLLALADEIVERLAAGGLLILSGLVSTDVPEMVACYAPRLERRRPEIFERGAWRTLVWPAAP
jgi:ribosomal protein L11 methyltransferase